SKARGLGAVVSDIRAPVGCSPDSAEGPGAAAVTRTQWTIGLDHMARHSPGRHTCRRSVLRHGSLRRPARSSTMSDINTAALFGKLNSLAYKAIEGASVFCKLRGNPYVELVHWLQQIMQTPDSDLHRIIKRFELDTSRLAKDVTESLDRLPRGATSISDLSAHVENAVERGWVYGTLMFGDNQVRTGYLMVGLVKTPSLRNALSAISRQFDLIKSDTLTDEFGAIVKGSPEERLSATDGSTSAAPGEASGAM